MKYFVLGALASGLLLYGMSMIYGATGTLDIDKVAAYGLAALVGGLAVKKLFMRDDRVRNPYYYDTRVLAGASPVIPPVGESH